MNQKLILSSNMLSIKRSITYCHLKLLRTSLNCNQIQNNYHSSNQLSNKEVNTSPSQEISSGDVSEKPVFESVKYTTSKAHLKHKAYQNFRYSDEEVGEVPVYERPIIIISAAIFFLYFGYFREENDLDKKMNSNLFELVPGLEIPMLESALKENERRGYDTRQLRERLNELKQLKEEVNRLEANKTALK